MAKDVKQERRKSHNDKRNRSHPLSPDRRREKRQKEAVERQEAYDALTTEEKIARLPREGHSLRELLRLGVPIED